MLTFLQNLLGFGLNADERRALAASLWYAAHTPGTPDQMHCSRHVNAHLAWRLGVLDLFDEMEAKWRAELRDVAARN